MSALHARNSRGRPRPRKKSRVFGRIFTNARGIFADVQFPARERGKRPRPARPRRAPRGNAGKRTFFRSFQRSMPTRNCSAQFGRKIFLSALYARNSRGRARTRRKARVFGRISPNARRIRAGVQISARARGKRPRPARPRRAPRGNAGRRTIFRSFQRSMPTRNCSAQFGRKIFLSALYARKSRRKPWTRKKSRGKSREPHVPRGNPLV